MADETNKTTAEAPEQKPEETKKPSYEELESKLKELESQLTKSKQAYNAASSDAAEWKKKFRETQDDATRTEAERTEEVEALKKQVAAFQRQTAIADSVAAFIAMGYPQDMAKKRAEYLADGDNVNAMAVEKEFLAYHDREMKAAAVRNTPAPVSGFQTGGNVTREQFSNMSLRERQDLKTKNPQLYAEYTKH